MVTKAAKKPTSSTLSQFGIEPYVEKKGEEYMNDSQKTHFKKILEAWRKQLMEEVDRTVDHMKDEAELPGSGGSRKPGRRVLPGAAYP